MTLINFLLGAVMGGFLTWIGHNLPHWMRSRPKATAPGYSWVDSGAIISGGVLLALFDDRFELSPLLMWLVVWGFLFLLIAIIDLKYRIIPNVLVYLALGLAWLFHSTISNLPLGVILSGGIFTFVIFYLTYLLRPGDLGGGDVKLALLIGFVLGFPTALWALLLGVGGGAVTAVSLLLLGRYSTRYHWTRKSHIPYGPFLCLGAIIALLYNPVPLIIP